MTQALSDDIAAAVLGGFLAWIVIGLATIVLRRDRLRSFLQVAFNLHLSEARDNALWLEKALSELSQGRSVGAPPKYTKNELRDLEQVRETSVELLTEREMRKVALAHSVLWEIEALMEGFCDSLVAIEQRRKGGEPVDLVHLGRRGVRILSLVQGLPATIVDIDKLPDEIPNRISAVSLISGEDGRNPDNRGAQL